jgi:hypothetical protein
MTSNLITFQRMRLDVTCRWFALCRLVIVLLRQSLRRMLFLPGLLTLPLVSLCFLFATLERTMLPYSMASLVVAANGIYALPRCFQL